MISLSIHSIFEGIALGLQPHMLETLNFALAIAVHKGTASSALGVSLVKAFPNDFKLVRKLVVVFALATPIGVVIGIMAVSAGEIVDVVMSSIAAGTFIYIACSDIVTCEFSISGNRVSKLLAFVIGVLVISTLTFLE